MLDLNKLFIGFVSKDELKPGLMGVCYDSLKNNLVATDGHKLFSLHDASSHITIQFEQPLEKLNRDAAPILPVEIFAEYEKRLKGKSTDYRLEHCRILITGNGSYEDQYFVEFQEKKHGLGEFKTFAGAECIDEQYPDYQSVIPERLDRGEVDSIGINPVLLYKMYMALKSYNDLAVTRLYFKSELAPITVRFWAEDPGTEDLDYDCIIMPIRI